MKLLVSQLVMQFEKKHLCFFQQKTLFFRDFFFFFFFASLSVTELGI